MSSAKREVERIGTRIKTLLNLMLDDEIAVDDGHPEMADLYRQKVTTLAQALERSDTRAEATEALRGLIDAIVLTPNQGELQIDLKENLAAMLGAAKMRRGRPKQATSCCKLKWLRGLATR